MDTTTTSPATQESAETTSALGAFKESVEKYTRTLLTEEDPANLYQQLLGIVQLPLLKMVLKLTGGNQSKAAEVLGISRGTLRKYMTDHDLFNATNQ